MKCGPWQWLLKLTSGVIGAERISDMPSRTLDVE